MLNHGIYTDCEWTLPVAFVSTTGAAVNMAGAQYVADVYYNDVAVFTFKSTGAAADEGTIDLTNAATGTLTFRATTTQHADLGAGLYRIHLKRDLTDDVWAADGALLVGRPGEAETYLKFDRSVGAAVQLPIIVGSVDTGDDLTTWDCGSATTDYTNIPLFDLGGASGAGFDLGGSV